MSIVCVYVFVSTSVNMCMCVCLCVCVHVYGCVYECVFWCECVCVCVYCEQLSVDVRARMSQLSMRTRGCVCVRAGERASSHTSSLPLPVVRGVGVRMDLSPVCSSAARTSVRPRAARASPSAPRPAPLRQAPVTWSPGAPRSGSSGPPSG